MNFFSEFYKPEGVLAEDVNIVIVGVVILVGVVEVEVAVGTKQKFENS